MVISSEDTQDKRLNLQLSNAVRSVCDSRSENPSSDLSLRLLKVEGGDERKRASQEAQTDIAFQETTQELCCSCQRNYFCNFGQHSAQQL